MKKMIEYFLKFGNLDSHQIDFIISKGEVLNLKKEDYFSKAGKIPMEVGFVVEGVIRGFYYNDLGEEITRCFISEDSLVCDYLNFENNHSSSEYINAITDCQLIVFSKQNWEELSRNIENWDIIKNKIVQLCMHQKSRKGPVISEDATSRYLGFLKNYPNLVNRIPLIYIASYIGVTQQSLSRIRKNI